MMARPVNLRGLGKAARRKAPGTMNGMERAFYETMKSWAGIAAVEYEAVTFKLAPDTRYTPDFYVLRDSGTIQFYECKGFEFQHSMVKVKVAAARFPEFEFFMVRRIAKKHGGGWDIKLIGPAVTVAEDRE